MTAADKVFVGSIPALYQQYMVPMIFEPYASDMAVRAAGLHPRRVLEIAAGTGVVTRALAVALPDTADIVATDISQPMLDLAATLQGDRGHVTFSQADALTLPFDAGSFDLVICQFGAMFFPDKLQAYREARRVLGPGGTYLLAVWDKVATNAFVNLASDVLARRFPDDPPRFMELLPHGYHDTAAISAVLSEAGFSDVRVDTVTKIAHAESAVSAATGYCQGTPLRAEIETREPGGIQAVTDAVAAALAQRFGSGAIEGEICAHIITAAA